MVLAVLLVVFSSNSDIDADGIIDQFDNCPDSPNPTQVDTDADLQGNECDPDDDNDTVLDEFDLFDEDPKEATDLDFDGIGDNADPDDDNDMVVDSIDAFDSDPREWADFDFDNIGSNQDPDDDNDGILDSEDPIPLLTTEQWTEKYLTQIQNCADDESETSRLLCYGTFFGILVESEDSNADALELALSLSKMGALDDCHFVSHEIGHAAFDENPNVFENLVGMNGDICRGGFYHGILAAYFHEIQISGQSITSSYKTICDDFIGDYNYNHCLHGLGHGLVHYYQDDLESSIELCDQLSFYQNDLCISGVMMQFTDNKITTKGLSKENITNLCLKSQLNSYDYLKCTATVGVTLAFHTNHNLEDASKFCEMIDENEGKKFCIAGLEQEIKKAKRDIESPLKEEQLGRLQPKWIKQGDKKWIVDFRSPATIIDFGYNEETKTMQFSFELLAEIRIYASSDILPEKLGITINGVSEKNVSINSDRYEDYTVITILPTESGIVQIRPL